MRDKIKKLKTFMDEHKVAIAFTSAAVATSIVNYAVTRRTMRNMEVMGVFLNKAHHSVRITFRDGHEEFFS